MFSPSAIVREMKAEPGQTKSEWLGAKARVPGEKKSKPM